MVEQPKSVTNSSIGGRHLPKHAIPCSLSYRALRPELAETCSGSGDFPFDGRDLFYEFGHVFPPVAQAFGNGRFIVGVMGRDFIDVSRWKEPPHKFLANLHEDEKSAEGFVKRYGTFTAPLVADILLRESKEPNQVTTAVEAFIKSHPASATQKIFADSVALLYLKREKLRRVWKNDTGEIERMEGEISMRAGTWKVQGGRIEIVLDDPWAFICALTLRDRDAGKLSVCSNPECPTPFFLKQRRTQKFCELGSCTAYAQRKYALRWWRSHAKK